LSHKHKITNEKSIRTSSGSTRKKLPKERENLNNTGPEFIMEKDKYHKVMTDSSISENKKMIHGFQGNLKMPTVVKNRPGNGIYGSFKASNVKEQLHTAVGKKKESLGYSGPQISTKAASRSILKAKMEIRNNSDSNENQYNLIFGNPDHSETGNMIISPVDANSSHLVSNKTVQQTQKMDSLNSQGKIMQKYPKIFASQENLRKDQMGKNDPYQNGFSDKTVIRAASEK